MDNKMVTYQNKITDLITRFEDAKTVLDHKLSTETKLLNEHSFIKSLLTPKQLKLFLRYQKEQETDHNTSDEENKEQEKDIVSYEVE